MKTTNRTVKIAASRIGRNAPDAESDPRSPSFSFEAARKYTQGNVDRTIASFVKAGEAGADAVCSIEDIKCMDPFISLEQKSRFLDLAETIPGPTSEMLAVIARRYNMHIAANYYERDGGDAYNTTVLLGRDGGIIGKYRKIHMPAHERWMAAPGADVPVFETDIGAIGLSICYDIVFPEHCRSLALNGADIVLHSTGGWGFTYGNLGMELLRVRAAENAVYIANAYSFNLARPHSNSCIVNNAGDALAINDSQTEDGIAIAGFAPDYDMMKERQFWAFFSGVPSARARTTLERMPETYGALTESRPPIVRGRYAGYRYARNYDAIKSISEKWSEYRQDGYDGREPKLPYEWE